MNVDQAREEWQSAGDYDSACRLIRAQAARIGQLERDLVEERENNVGEFESRTEAERKVRTLKAQVVGLEQELEGARQLVFASGVELGKAEAELAAEKALANQLASDLGLVLSERDAEKARADRLWRIVKGIALMDEACDTCEDYRKARGL